MVDARFKYLEQRWYNRRLRKNISGVSNLNEFESEVCDIIEPRSDFYRDFFFESYPLRKVFTRGVFLASLPVADVGKLSLDSGFFLTNFYNLLPVCAESAGELDMQKFSLEPTLIRCCILQHGDLFFVEYYRFLAAVSPALFIANSHTTLALLEAPPVVVSVAAFDCRQNIFNSILFLEFFTKTSFN